MHLEGDRRDEQRGKKMKNESGRKNLGSAPNGRCGGWVWRLVTFDGGDGGGGRGAWWLSLCRVVHACPRCPFLCRGRDPRFLTLVPFEEGIPERPVNLWAMGFEIVLDQELACATL